MLLCEGLRALPSKFLETRDKRRSDHKNSAGICSHATDVTCRRERFARHFHLIVSIPTRDGHRVGLPRTGERIPPRRDQRQIGLKRVWPRQGHESVRIYTLDCLFQTSKPRSCKAWIGDYLGGKIARGCHPQQISRADDKDSCSERQDHPLPATAFSSGQGQYPSLGSTPCRGLRSRSSWTG